MIELYLEVKQKIIQPTVDRIIWKLYGITWAQIMSNVD